MDAALSPVPAPQQAFARMVDTLFARGNALAQAPSASPALQHAQRAWLDTLACMLGGAAEPATRAAASAADSASAEHLALVLGTASHALDYDDVCMLATCHPSAPVVAALLASLNEANANTTLAQLLAAHLVGCELMLRLGEWLGFEHYALGFHATGTLGVVGAAAACAQLAGLPMAQVQTALAIAASSASGLRANFGSDTKPLHVGFAASAAVRAVKLAQAGATASADAIAGFAQAFSGLHSAGELPALAFTPGTPWAVLAPGFEIKRYPSCYMTHRLIAGILRLRAQHAPQPGDAPIVMQLSLPPGGTAPLKYPQPATGLQAKFSAPYCAAAAWCDGQVGLASFSNAAVLRPALATQMAQVSVSERSGPHEALESAPVHITLRAANWQAELNVDWAPGSLADPLSAAELLAKWQDCAAHSGLPADALDAARWLQAAPSSRPQAELLALRQALLRHGSARSS